MRLRGLPPIPEENLAWARGVIAWPPVEPDEDEVRWLLDEDRRFEEPEEYTDNAGLIADDGSDSPPERIPITPRGASPQPLGIPNEYIPIEEDETYGSDPGLTADDTRSLSPSSRRLAAIELDAPNPLSDEWNPEMEDEQIALQDVESTPSLTWSSSADESGPATPEQVLELGDAVRIVGGEEGRSVGVSGFEGEDREGVSGFEAEGWEGEVEGD